MARALALASLLLALPACKSSAPYTVPAAALNTALAVGVSAAQRSAGGCYADCIGGTVCNPKTGFCEKPIAVCVGSEADTLPCAGQAGSSSALQTQRPGMDPGAGASPPPFGISPATGSVPPPPGTSPGRP